jgi:hypothetical protein
MAVWNTLVCLLQLPSVAIDGANGSLHILPTCIQTVQRCLDLLGKSIELFQVGEKHLDLGAFFSEGGLSRGDHDEAMTFQRKDTKIEIDPKLRKEMFAGVVKNNGRKLG